MALPLEVWHNEVCSHLDWTTLAKLSCATKEFAAANLFQTITSLDDLDKKIRRQLRFLRRIKSTTKLSVRLRNQYEKKLPPLPWSLLTKLVLAKANWIELPPLPNVKTLKITSTQCVRKNLGLDTPVLEKLQIIRSNPPSESLDKFLSNWKVPKTLQRITFGPEWEIQSHLAAQEIRNKMAPHHFQTFAEFQTCWKTCFPNGLLVSVFDLEVRKWLAKSIDPDAPDISGLLSPAERVQIAAQGHPDWFRKIVKLALSYGGDEPAKQRMCEIALWHSSYTPFKPRFVAVLKYLETVQNIKIETKVWQALVQEWAAVYAPDDPERVTAAKVFFTHPSFFDAICPTGRGFPNHNLITMFSCLETDNLQNYPAFLTHLEQYTSWLDVVPAWVTCWAQLEPWEKYAVHQVLQTPLAMRMIPEGVQTRFWNQYFKDNPNK